MGSVDSARRGMALVRGPRLFRTATFLLGVLVLCVASAGAADLRGIDHHRTFRDVGATVEEP